MDAMARARSFLRSDACHRRFLALYGGGEADVSAQVARYGAVLDKFSGLFPGHADVAFVSAPGRAEIGGNHTDHQNGRVLAAAVNLDTVAVAAPNGGMAARVHSEGFGLTEVDLMDLAPRPPKGESGTAAMIRGCAARMRALGLPISGFDAAATSAVGTGSGLSSSAACEVLIVTILDSLFGAGDMDPVLRAQIAQHAENHFVHKPSGLMDQTASSVGGLVAIDFEPQGGDSLRNPFHGADS